jgi:hypothetical protein
MFAEDQYVDSIYTLAFFHFMNNVWQFMCIVSELLIMTLYILATSITHWPVIRAQYLDENSVVLSLCNTCFDNIGSSS